MQTFVDRPDEAELLRQNKQNADATVGDGLSFIRDVVVDVSGGESWLHEMGSASFFEPSLDAALAFVEPSAENGFHLKSFRGFGAWEARYSSSNAKRRRISSFSKKSCADQFRPRLFKD